MEVAFDGEELNPIEFLTMLYGNIQALRKAGHEATHEFIQFDGEMKTRYDRDKEEIEELMIRFLPVYMEDLFRGAYTVPEYTERSLRNVFAVGATKIISLRLCRAWQILLVSAAVPCRWQVRYRIS